MKNQELITKKEGIEKQIKVLTDKPNLSEMEKNQLKTLQDELKDVEADINE